MFAVSMTRNISNIAGHHRCQSQENEGGNGQCPIASYMCMKNSHPPSQRPSNTWAQIQPNSIYVRTPFVYMFSFFFTHIILFSWLGHLTVCCLSCVSILLINTVSIYFSIQVLFQFLSLYKSMVYLRCSVRPGIKVINIKSDFKVSIQITLECLLYLLLLSWPTSVSLSLPTYLKSRDSPLT